MITPRSTVLARVSEFLGWDGGQVVDPKDTVDLCEQSLYEAEVAAGAPGDGGDGFGRR